MSITRSFTWLIAALLALAVLAALPANGPTLLADPLELLAWWERHGTAAAAVGLLHAAALITATYVAGVLWLISAAAIARVPTSAARPLLRLAPRTIRRHLAAGVAVATLALPAAVSAQETIVLVDLGDAPSAVEPIPLVDLGPAGPDVDTAGREPSSPDRSAVPPPASDEVALIHRGLRPSTTTSAVADAWLVEPGDHLWAIAEAIVGDRVDDGADESTVAAYWRALIAANRSTIDNPDVIHPGQVVNLPPIFTAGS